MSDNEDVKVESDIATCRLCEKLVVRRCVGKFPNGRDKMYVDEDGKLWSGRRCPKCQADRAKSNMQRLRKSQK